MASLATQNIAQEARAPIRMSITLPTLDIQNHYKKPSQQTTPPVTPPISRFRPETEEICSLRLSDFGPITDDEEPLVAVIGCGYVGTHLIKAFSSCYDVMGFDVSEIQLAKAEKEFGGPESRAIFTLDPMDLTKATHFLVSVPTLLQADQTVNTSYIESALANIALYARPGSTIVIESSVAVGMTRQLVGPLAKQRGFFAGMSPERVDPGRIEPTMTAIPKIVSGLDDEVPGSLSAIMKLYLLVFDTVIPVANPETAEMTKLYENCQRMINIAYANEMADACAAHGINPFEVCRAAASKPFGYMPFTPGLGVGGHCIPVNPYYLMSNNSFPLLQAATESMWQRPAEIGQRVIDYLLKRPAKVIQKTYRSLPERTESGSRVSANERSAYSKNRLNHTTTARSEHQLQALRRRVLVVGVGFKAGQSTVSNSPGRKLIQKLADSGVVDVAWADALVAQSTIPHIPYLSMDQWNRENLEAFDMIIVAFRQTGMDFDILSELRTVKVEMWCP
ncbi:hypothetical protein F5Y19DRAFT_478957 [Xylariaceae sp. FL1651]|nr:hypothetical protein F5Y19DRAFT_478957 [Xylariaceae sp. FL1651]